MPDQEQALRKLLFHLASEANLAVLVTDGDLREPGPRIVAVNPAFEVLSGYTAEELIGANPRLFQGARTSLLKRQRMRRAIQAGRPHTTELWNYRKSGEAYYCRIEVFPLCGADGAPWSFVAIEREVKRKPGRRSGG